MAAEQAGGDGGLVGYLKQQAEENPAPFLSLLGKVLPIQVNADVQHRHVKELSDDELITIATGGSARASKAQGSTAGSDSVH